MAVCCSHKDRGHAPLVRRQVVRARCRSRSIGVVGKLRGSRAIARRRSALIEGKLCARQSGEQSQLCCSVECYFGCSVQVAPFGASNGHSVTADFCCSSRQFRHSIMTSESSNSRRSILRRTKSVQPCRTSRRIICCLVSSRRFHLSCSCCLRCRSNWRRPSSRVC